MERTFLHSYSTEQTPAPLRQNSGGPGNDLLMYQSQRGLVLTSPSDCARGSSDTHHVSEDEQGEQQGGRSMRGSTSGSAGPSVANVSTIGAHKPVLGVMA